MNGYKKIMEKSGWLSVRAAGSKGVADVWAIKPANSLVCSGTYQVKLIQVKVSQKIKKGSITTKWINTPIGEVPIEYWVYPVRVRK